MTTSMTTVTSASTSTSLQQQTMSLPFLCVKNWASSARDVMRKARDKEETLCEQILRAKRSLQISEMILKEKLEGFLGNVFFGFRVFEDTPEYQRCLWISSKLKRLTLTEETQDEIYRMGFIRVEIRHEDGSLTYFYKGGDSRGYHTNT